MNNFEHATEATETAMNAMGSAAEENSKYMEGLEAKTNQLKQTFQELSNAVVESDLLKLLLDFANAGLSVLNTDFGVFLTQIGLLTGVLTGVISIGSKLMASLFGIGKAAGVASAAVGAAGAAGGAGGLASALAAAASSALPMAAAISAVVAIIWALYKAYKHFNPSQEELEERLTNQNTKLAENKKRLEELKNISIASRSPEIEAEINALEEENKQLEYNIKLLDERNNKGKLQEIRNSADFVEKNRGVKLSLLDPQENLPVQYQGNTLQELLRQLIQSGEIGQEWNNTIQQLNNGTISFETALSNLKTELGSSIFSIEEFASTNKSLEDSLDDMVNRYEYFQDKIESGQSLTIEEQQEFVALQNNILSAREALGEIDQSTEGYTKRIGDFLLKTADSEIVFAKLNKVLLDSGESMSLLNQSLADLSAGMTISTEYKNVLTKALPEINNYLEESNGYWQLNSEKLIQAAKDGDTWAQEMIKNFDTVIQKAIELAEINYSNLVSHAKSIGQTSPLGYNDPEYLSARNDLVELRNQINLYKEQQKKWKDVDLTPDPTGTGTGKVKTRIDLLKEELDLLDHEAEILQKNGSNYQSLINIYQQAQEKILDLTEYYKSQNYSMTSDEIRELEDLWWDYVDKIDKIKESFYDKLTNYVNEEADREIESLQKRREEEEEYWDNKINALKEQNEELDRQIELEKLQDSLAKARQSKILVYSNGRFQYMEDIDEISQAQGNLEQYQRDEVLRQEVENLERLKNQALDSIDEQIEGWEEYKEEWSDLVDSYTKDQEELLFEQELGIELEGENWETRLSNLREYVEEYENLMNRVLSAGSITFGYSNNSTSSSSISVSSQGKNPRRNKSYAEGTHNAEGGLSLVGEEGPELRVLNKGDHILPSNITKNLWEWGMVTPSSMISNLSSGLNKLGEIINITIDNFTPNLPNITNGDDFANYLKHNFWRQVIQYNN